MDYLGWLIEPFLLIFHTEKAKCKHFSLSLGKKGNFLENLHRGSLYKAATVKKKFFIFCII